MSIFKRFSDVARSNINALIEKAEDPEKMANQIILDLEKLQREATEGVAATIAEEKRLKNLVEQNKADMEKWENRALQCLKQGDEDMARDAVRQKQKCEADFKTHYSRHEEQVARVNTLKDNLHQLSEKIAEARSRRDALVARGKSAKAQATISRAASSSTAGDLLGKLDKMEEKVQRTEATAEAFDELRLGDDVERKFKEMEKKQSVDDELAALKKKLNEE
jgi:phage shock protein A